MSLCDCCLPFDCSFILYYVLGIRPCGAVKAEDNVVYKKWTYTRNLDNTGEGYSATGSEEIIHTFELTEEGVCQEAVVCSGDFVYHAFIGTPSEYTLHYWRDDCGDWNWTSTVGGGSSGTGPLNPIFNGGTFEVVYEEPNTTWTYEETEHSTNTAENGTLQTSLTTFGTATQVKFWAAHKSNQACYLKIWFRYLTYNSDLEVTGTTGLGSYEWIGTGSPCFDGQTPNTTEIRESGDGHVLPQPEEFGFNVLQMKWSCVKDYEPDWYNVENPFPCPHTLPVGFPCPGCIPGCQNPCATNYNPYACEDDGSCYGVISGCTNACDSNYNPEACEDDESCNGDNANCGGWF